MPALTPSLQPQAPIALAGSPEVFAIPLDGSAYLFYAPLRRAAFIGNAAVLEVLAGLRRGEQAAAAGPTPLLELLRNLEIIGGGPQAPPSIECEGDPRPVALTLLLTTACNLRCTYCYASAGGAAPQSMNMDTARRGIDFIAANAVSRQVPAIEAGYHGGGEPTLNWPVLTASHDYARRKAAELQLGLRTSLATNGVLDDRRIDWLLANLDGVCLSCDGLPELHDSCRPTAQGEGSSERVFHTMRRFDQAKFNYGLRLTVVAEHVSRLADSVDYLLSEFHPRSIQIEPVYLLGRGAGAASAESDAFIAAYREAAGRARARQARISFSGARAGTLTNHFCGVSLDNFCLSADGNVTACFEAFSEDGPLAGEFFYGRPGAGRAGYVFNHTVLNRLRSQTIGNRPHCRDCFAQWNCGGDCYYKWLAATGGGEFRGSARCRVIQELTKDQILENIYASGGCFWHATAPVTGGNQTAGDAC